MVVKVFRLLEALGQTEQGQSLASLAQEVHLAKPTAHRLLKMMTGLGYVGRTEQGLYRLTGKLQRLTMRLDDRRLVEMAEPVLWQLHEQTGETVNFGVLRQDRVVYLRVIESRQPLRRVAEPLSTQHFHCGALGRVLAAGLESRRRESLLRRSAPLEKRTPFTVVDVDELRQILELAEREGFAVEHDQTDVGVTCVGAPVRRFDQVIAAVSVSVPTARCDAARELELIEQVRRTAEQLSGQLSPPLEAAS